MLQGPGKTVAIARKLRRAMSLPEVLLWQALRQRPVGFKFRRQHPAGPFVLDFTCLEARLAVEVDSDVHNRSGAPDHDLARDKWLFEQGYETMRVRANDIFDNFEAVVALIIDRCESRQPLHRLSAGPSPRIGED